MRPEDLLALLGCYNTDPLVEAALVYYEVRNRPEMGGEVEAADDPMVKTQAWVKNSRAGIEFGFDDEVAWIGHDELNIGNGPMLLTQIYLYGHHQDVRQYKEPLPFGLQFSDDRATVRKKLYLFESTRHSYISDTWDTPKFRFTVRYGEGDSCIGYVVCALREPPLPLLTYALAPVPSVKEIAELLGGAVDDPAMELAFGPLGLRGRIGEIKESGEADLRRPYGVSLEFAIPERINNPSAKEILLVSVSFFPEREQGARSWPGKLPNAICFDDSLETIIKKVGRMPDSQNIDEDIDFSGVAVWYEPQFTISVFFDTMDNRTIRVAVTAPGLLRRFV